MSGTSSSTQQQSSTTQPWAAAQPALQGILTQLKPMIENSGLNGAQTGAINQLSTNAAGGNPYASQIGANANGLLNGGGATNQAGAVNQNYQNYQAQTNPLASNTNYNPFDTPGFRDAINTATSDITNATNGQFAAAGRDFSGANSMALGRGLTQGLAPTIAAQYNQNVQNQQGAASNLFNAGNTNAGIQAGLQQQDVANRQAGTQAATDALSAKNWGPTATLAAEGLRQGIPAQNLGMLANIGVPIAGLGSQSQGTSTGTQTMSPWQQLMQGANLFSGGSGNGGNQSIAQGLLAFLSDRRAKEDIEQVGTLFDGTPVYRFRYIGQPAMQIGLMAQDVEKIAPEAVSEINGVKFVNYQIATEKAVEAA